MTVVPPSDNAVNFFVAVTLFALAATYLFAGRRRPWGFLFAAFLGLVGINFLAIGIHQAGGGNAWAQVAGVALALDPFFFLAFVTAFPYRRRGPGVKLLLAVLAFTGLYSAYMFVAHPELIAPDPFLADYYSVPHIIVILQLALAYSAGWFLAVRAIAEAPTSLLARQAAWAAAAVGVMVVPRVGALHSDFNFSASAFLGDPDPANIYVEQMVRVIWHGVIWLALAAGVYLLGVLAWVSALRRPFPFARQSLLFVAAVAGLLIVLAASLRIWSNWGGPRFAFGVVYGLRWVVFSGILVYGMLEYEILEFRHASERGLSWLVAGIGGVGVFLAVYVFLLELMSSGAAFPVAGFVALGSVVPLRAGARAALRSLQARQGTSELSARRLELYRAALEAAWARGPPGDEVRRVLERDRRAFGVSTDEARALEHVVASGSVRARPRLGIGDEPMPGLLIERLIGEGAQGRIYEAIQHAEGTRVVVKEFHADRLGSGAARRNLVDELRALEGLSHPNIVKVLDVDETRHRYLLVLEYVEGRTLADRLAEGPLAPAEVRTVVSDILAALDFAHGRGVVHRDIKPSNVMVRNDGRAVLTDFGIASSTKELDLLRETASNLFGMDRMAGTLSYLPPERLRREDSGGTAGDLYQVGLVAYEVLTGRPALDIQGLGLLDAMQKVGQPSFDFKAIPGPWRGFLEKSLEPDSHKRYGSAADMLKHLPAAGGRPR